MAVRLELEDKFQVGQDPEGLSHCDIVNSHLPPGVQVCGGVRNPVGAAMLGQGPPHHGSALGVEGVRRGGRVRGPASALSPVGAVVGVLDDRRSVV